MNLEQEIDALYERSTKTQSREDFGKLYHADKGNNIDGLFKQVQKLQKVAPVDKIDFYPVNTKSNLTPAQQVAFAKRRKEMGMATVDTAAVRLSKETIDGIEKQMSDYTKCSPAFQETKRKELFAKATNENDPDRIRYNLLKQKFSAAFNITEDKYLALTEKQKSDAEIDLAIAIKYGKIKCPANYTPVHFTLLDQIRRERGW